MTDVTLLDNILRTLKRPRGARVRVRIVQTKDYTRGLHAMGWTMEWTGPYDEFTKGSLRIRVYRDGKLLMLRNGEFIPVPAKARRNIILAGQWK